MSAEDLSLEQRASYIMGYYMSQQIMGQLSQGGFDQQLAMAGLSAGLQGQPPLISQDQWQAIMQAFQQQGEERDRVTAARNQAAAEQHLADIAKKDGVTVTASGLAYEVITPAEGPKPSATSTVKVHYHGTLLNGSVFDSSVERGEPVEFPLNRVIPGWTEGLQKMPVGSKFRFHIPANLAYGSEGRPGIPPNSLLIFEVELLSIK
ncbi:MAG: FKBP-type peptidyl-prolyl cis-trans isomerase [Planctomycetota bacterium]|nr:MAG: FKBP-type peptidyl-prolyl cis-trans isomerase [Planctomycetota bacterium]